MSKKPKIRIVDTNVPIVANQATIRDPDSDVPDTCIEKCVLFIKEITDNGILLLDEDGEILNEYRRHLSANGQPGQGNIFLKWIYNNIGNISKIQFIKINKDDYSYTEFPGHTDLNDFDLSDRKFIACASAHLNKPHIIQAADSKWLKWDKGLKSVGISVVYLCLDYINAKYNAKHE